MVNQLFSHAKKPVLWQRSSELFWDDEHISKQMLEAHLNPEWEAASRRHSDIERSVKWLGSIIPEGSRILDIGCGPGLYTKRLSHMGYDVTGIDYSRRSIGYAREQDNLTKYIYQNYLELDDTDTFDAITLIYCDYGALTLSERQALLTRVYRALKPGGLFIFDAFTERTLKGKQDNTAWSLCEHGGFWNSKPYLCLEGDYYYENNSVTAGQTLVITEDELKEYIIWNTVFTKEALAEEVLPFGFRIKDILDDVCGNPYTGEADTLCAVLKKE